MFGPELRRHCPTADRMAELTMLDGLRGRERRRLARHFEPIAVAPGDVLIAEGQRNHHAYFVVAGEVEVVRCGGRVTVLGPDSLVGERTAYGAITANATVRALTAGVVLAVDHRALLAIADDRPEIGSALVDLLAERAA